jgi:SAM-dependent methyltransferase
MEYKIDPEQLKKYLEGLDLSKFKEDFSSAPYSNPPDYGIQPRNTDFSLGGENLAARVKMAKLFDGLNILTASRAKDIEQIMALLIMRGSVNPDILEGNVLDFGMGTGPGSYVLNQYGANVTGVDSSESGVKRAIEEGILPADRALVQDGFKYLEGLQPASLDFLGAFMMHSGFPHERLYQASERVLKSGGQLLITGGHTELKNELQRTVGRYGKVEDVITVHDDATLGNVAFTYTKR